MAYDRYWVGPNDTDCSFSDTANWSTSLGGAGGASVPTSNDSAAIIGGTSRITSGLDQSSAFNGVLYVSFDGSIGSAGSPLKTDCIRLEIAGVGAPSYFGSDASVTELLVYDASLGSVSWTTGTATTAYIGANGTFNNAGTITTMHTAGIGVTNTGTITNFRCYGGNHTSSTTIADAQVHGGTLRLTGSAAIYASGNAGVLYVYPGARYIHNSSGTIDAIEVFPNAIATARGASAPFIISGGNRWVNSSYFENSPVSITGTGATNPGRRGFGY